MVNRTAVESAQHQVKTGFERMAHSRVAICGLARDCKKALARLVPKLEQLGKCFEAYRVIVVENNSKDGTAEFLPKWRAANPNIKLLQFSAFPWAADHKRHETRGKWWFSEARMERMNFARNQYLDALGDSDCIDYVIVVDLDILSFSLAGIAHTFGLSEQWDFVASNGSRYSVRHPFRKQVYWDTYAYEPAEGFPGDVLRRRAIVKRQTLLAEVLRRNTVLPVRSAFGGLCIYRRKALADHRYSLIKNDDQQVRVLCDHNSLHRSMARAGDVRAFINPYQEVRYDYLSRIIMCTMTGGWKDWFRSFAFALI